MTGQRGDDPLVEKSEETGHIQKYNSPTHHTRVLPLLEWGEKQVWAYIKREFVSYCELYDDGYHHTDAMCCTDDDQDHDEYGGSGRDPEKRERRQQLDDMGYI